LHVLRKSVFAEVESSLHRATASRSAFAGTAVVVLGGTDVVVVDGRLVVVVDGRLVVEVVDEPVVVVDDVVVGRVGELGAVVGELGGTADATVVPTDALPPLAPQLVATNPSSTIPTSRLMIPPQGSTRVPPTRGGSYQPACRRLQLLRGTCGS